MSNHLADEARKRGIEPIELKPGDDLEQLVRDAVAGGADGLAAAGGDGTQALVASIAAEHDLPFACIPAGTRNHFALDLGVDRDDVVGALDAFVNGGERRIDLAEVNGRVFVNNVSLGLYAEAVQREGYRDAKLRTILDTAPDVLGSQPSGPTSELGWRGEDGTAHESAAVILVSNNTYRLGRPVGSGTRPRIDGGELGVAVLNTASRSGRPLAAMVDAHVRGHIVATGTRWRRRRGARHGSAASLPQPAERPAGAPRATTPRRLTIGRAPRRDRRPAQATPRRGRRTGLRLEAPAVPVEQTPTRRGLPWPPPGEEFLARPGRAVGCASVLLALVVLGALLIPAGPLALDSRWSELMQDIETSVPRRTSRWSSTPSATASGAR